MNNRTIDCANVWSNNQSIHWKIEQTMTVAERQQLWRQWYFCWRNNKRVLYFEGAEQHLKLRYFYINALPISLGPHKTNIILTQHWTIPFYPASNHSTESSPSTQHWPTPFDPESNHVLLSSIEPYFLTQHQTIPFCSASNHLYLWTRIELSINSSPLNQYQTISFYTQHNLWNKRLHQGFMIRGTSNTWKVSNRLCLAFNNSSQATSARAGGGDQRNIFPPLP